MKPSSVLPRASALLALLAVVNALPRVGHFSGDALIHLSIAERAAAGGWFEFNPGEVSSGSTSFGWTALEALLLRLGGLPLLTVVIPLLDLGALVGCGLLLGHLGRRAGGSPAAATLAALLFVAIPAVTYNALLGMENIVHVLAVLATLSVFARSPSPARDALLGALLGTAVTLRPEGALLVVLPLLDLGRRGREPATRSAALRGFALTALVAAAVYAPAAWTHFRVTGHLVPGSGVSRLMAVRREPSSLHLVGPLWLYLGAALRFVVYAPLTALAAAGLRAAITDDAPRALRRACGALFAAGLALYTLGTGAAHIGRLTQWLFALLAVLLAPGLDAALAWAEGHRRRTLILLAAALVHGGLCAAETFARLRDETQLHGGVDRAWILARARNRPRATTTVLETLCGAGCCAHTSVPTIAMTEVQLRFDYDARVRVSSLDGRTASARGTLRFDARGCPDLEAMLTAPEVVGVMEPPLAQFAPCRARSATARALTDAWGGAAPAPAGWRWAPTLPGWVRVCE